MKRIVPFILAVLSVFSCSQSSEIPFEEVKNYFFRKDATIPDNPIIDSAGQFEEFFGAAAYMGKGGQPTAIDFDKEFVIAVVGPLTDSHTELAPESLRKEHGGLVFTYKETIGEKQSWTMQPVLLIKVDREYLTEGFTIQRVSESFLQTHQNNNQ